MPGQTLPDSGLPMLLLDCAGIANAAGLRFHARRRADRRGRRSRGDAGRAARLLFDDLDGARRAVAAGGGRPGRDRSTPTRSADAAGRIRLVDRRAHPAAGRAGRARRRAQPHRRAAADRRRRPRSPMRSPRRSTSSRCPTRDRARARPGPIAGVVLIDGEQVELLDAYWAVRRAERATPAGDAAALPASTTSDGLDGRRSSSPCWRRRAIACAADAARRRDACGDARRWSGADVPASAAPVVRLRRESRRRRRQRLSLRSRRAARGARPSGSERPR